MVFVMSRVTKFVKREARCFAMWFGSPRRLVQGKNENLSPSVKRLLCLLTLWTLSDHPYLVEVLHRRRDYVAKPNSWVGRLEKVQVVKHTPDWPQFRSQATSAPKKKCQDSLSDALTGAAKSICQSFFRGWE